jgi:hypothetical protein
VRHGARKIDRAEDVHIGLRRVRADEDAHVVADRFAFLAERPDGVFPDREPRACFGGRRMIEPRIAERAEHVIREDDEFAADVRAVESRDDGDRARLAQRSGKAFEHHQSSRSMKTWIVPPQVSPTEIASSSLIP